MWVSSLILILLFETSLSDVTRCNYGVWSEWSKCSCDGTQTSTLTVLNDICQSVYEYSVPNSFAQEYSECWKVMKYLIDPESWTVDKTTLNRIVQYYREQGFDPYSRNLCSAQKYLLRYNKQATCPAISDMEGFPWNWPWNTTTPDCDVIQDTRNCTRSGCGTMGINYSTKFKNPNVSNPIALGVSSLVEQGFRKFKLFQSEGSSSIDTLGVLKAWKDEGYDDIEVMFGIPNYALANVSIDASWIEPLLPYRDIITSISIGNEPFIGDAAKRFAPLLNDVCVSVAKAIDDFGRFASITIPFSMVIIGSNSYPPVAGHFDPEKFQMFDTCLSIMDQQNASFTINIYPYVTYLDTSSVSLEYATGSVPSGSSQCFDDSGKEYCNLFDAQYDTVRYALDSAGYTSMDLQIGEIGWPTGGQPAGPYLRSGANVQVACDFINSLLRKGYMELTPRLRQLQIEGSWLEKDHIQMYLFEAFDESLKDTMNGTIPFETSWGIWTEDGKSLKFPLDLSGTRGYESVCNNIASVETK